MNELCQNYIFVLKGLLMKLDVFWKMCANDVVRHITRGPNLGLCYPFRMVVFPTEMCRLASRRCPWTAGPGKTPSVSLSLLRAPGLPVLWESAWRGLGVRLLALGCFCCQRLVA